MMGFVRINYDFRSAQWDICTNQLWCVGDPSVQPNSKRLLPVLDSIWFHLWADWDGNSVDIGRILCFNRLVHISGLVSMDHIGSRLPPRIRSTPIYGHSEGSPLVQGSFPSTLVTGCCITEFGSSLIISIDCFPPVLGYRLPNVIATIYPGHWFPSISYPRDV